MSDLNLSLTPNPAFNPGLSDTGLGATGVVVNGASVTVDLNELVGEEAVDTTVRLQATANNEEVYPGNSDIPQLETPEERKTNPFQAPSSLPKNPSDEKFDKLIAFFSPPGLNPNNLETGTENYTAFLQKYPEGSEEYKALMVLAFPEGQSPDVISAAMELINPIRNTIVMTQVLAASVESKEETKTGDEIEEQETDPSANQEEGSLFTDEATGKPITGTSSEGTGEKPTAIINPDGSTSYVDGDGNPVDANGKPIQAEGEISGKTTGEEGSPQLDSEGNPVGPDGKPLQKTAGQVTQSTNEDGSISFTDSSGKPVDAEGKPLKSTQEASPTVTSTTASLTQPPAADVKATSGNVNTGTPPQGVGVVPGAVVTATTVSLVTAEQIEASLSVGGKTIDPTTGVDDISGEVKALLDEMNNINGQIEGVRVQLENLPASKDKSLMLEYLAKISAAVITFTEILNNLQAYDSGKTRELSAAKLTDTLAKLAKQKKAIRKQRQKASKGKSKGVKQVFDKIMKSITVAIILVTAWLLVISSAGLLTPVSAILVAQAVDMCMKMAGKEGVWSQMYEGIENLASVWGKAMGMSDKQIERFKVALKSVVMAVLLILVAGPTFLVGGDAMKSILFEADMIKNKIAQMVIGILIDVTIAAVQILVAIAVAIISFGGGGATIQLIFAPIMQIMNAAMGGVKMATTVKVAMEVIQYSMMIVNVTYSVVTQTQAIITSVAKMKLNRQIGNLELDIKMRETMIELLKKLIQSLQESISGLSSAVSSIMEGHNNMMKSLSQTMSQLYTV